MPLEDQMFVAQPTYDRDALLQCARGDLFGPFNAQLPEPPMLTIDRITEISADGGDHGKGHVFAEATVSPDSWYFKGHFPGNPVMPGVIAMDTVFQLIGFNLGWRGLQGQGYGLGAGDTKFFGKVTPQTKRLSYRVHMTRVMQLEMSLGIGNAVVLADDVEIYSFKKVRVGLALAPEVKAAAE